MDRYTHYDAPTGPSILLAQFIAQCVSAYRCRPWFEPNIFIRMCLRFVYRTMFKEMMVHFQPDFLRCDSLYCAFHFRLVVVGSVLSFLLNMCSIVCESAHCVCIYYIKQCVYNCTHIFSVRFFIFFFFLGMECRVERRTILTNVAYGAVVCVFVLVSMNFLLGWFEHRRHIHSFANAWTICDTQQATAVAAAATTPFTAVHGAYSSDGMYVNFSVRLILFSSFLSLTFGCDFGVLSFKHQAQRTHNTHVKVSVFRYFFCFVLVFSGYYVVYIANAIPYSERVLFFALLILLRCIASMPCVVCGEKRKEVNCF